MHIGGISYDLAINTTNYFFIKTKDIGNVAFSCKCFELLNGTKQQK